MDSWPDAQGLIHRAGIYVAEIRPGHKPEIEAGCWIRRQAVDGDPD
jgi:hypothetical protein